MQKILVASLLALSFTTGFTCSKQAPPAETAPAATEVAPAQEQMGTPAETAPAAPAEGTAAPAPENK